VYERITEVSTNGNSHYRVSSAEQRWTINVAASGTTRTFYVKAFHSISTDSDDFLFEYSTNGSTFLPILTVTKTADNGQYQTFALPGTLSGNVTIRARDTDRTPGHGTTDTLSVDHMYVRSQ